MKRIVLYAVLTIVFSTAPAVAQNPNHNPLPSLWPTVGGVIQIPYERRDNRPNIKTALEKAVETWNATGRISFYEVSFPNQTAVCARVVVVASHPNYSGVDCGATHGYRGKGPDANVMLTANCGTITTLTSDFVHELGHAAGLIHEHQRQDRDAFITLTSLQGTATYQPYALQNFVNTYQYTPTHTYAYLSVMHYPLNAPKQVPAKALWLGKVPKGRALFHFTQDQQAQFNIMHPNTQVSAIGANPGTVSSLDVQALTHLYLLTTPSDAKISDICR